MRGAGSDGLSVATVESIAGFRGLEGEWRALEERLPALPFVTFDWLLSWWENLAERRLSIRDQLHLLSFRNAAGELVAVAPLMLTVRPGVGPLALRQLQLFGADPNVTELRTVVVAEADRGEVYAALVRHLHAQARRWDWLLLTGVPRGHGLEASVEQCFSGVQWLRSVPDYTLELPNTYAEFKLSLSRNIKESLRKCYNSLKRNGLSFEFHAVSAPEEIEPALEHFFRLHRSRAALADTVSHPDVFASEQSRRFLRAVCQRFAQRDKLRVFQLEIGGNVVATRIGFVCGSGLYMYFSGYDPAFGQYSVMTTLLAESIRFAIDQGLASMNLSTGRDVSKLRWSPREREYGDVLIVAPSRRGQVAFGLCEAAKGALRAAQQHTRVLDSLTRRASPSSSPRYDVNARAAASTGAPRSGSRPSTSKDESSPPARDLTGHSRNEASPPASERVTDRKQDSVPPESDWVARNGNTPSERSLRVERLSRP